MFPGWWTPAPGVASDWTGAAVPRRRGRRSALLALADLDVTRVHIYARNQAKGEQLLAWATEATPDIVVSIAPLDQTRFAGTEPGVVSSPPGGAADDFPIPGPRAGLLFDAVYAAGRPRWPRTALAGMTVVGGLDLVHQAARQFQLFTGLPAPLDAMFAAGRCARRDAMIVLIRFMGAGKTTIGQLLAEHAPGAALHRLRRSDRAGRGATVRDIFEAQGEAGFRRVEAATIAGLLTGPDCVLALGRGAPTTPEVGRRSAAIGCRWTWPSIHRHWSGSRPTLPDRCCTSRTSPGVRRAPGVPRGRDRCRDGERALATRHRRRRGAGRRQRGKAPWTCWSSTGPTSTPYA